jgi:hypothetical protein
MASPPENVDAPPAPTQKPTGTTINLGSQSVIMVKVAGAIMAIVILIVYTLAISYFESPFWILGIIFGGVAVGIGIAGIFIGNLVFSKKRYMPTLNVLLIIISILFFFMMPIFGNWEDPRTIGESIFDYMTMFLYTLFAILMVCYIELAHASIRFSQIDDYATSHNLKEFSVQSVITNYFIWFGILIAIIFIITIGILVMQIGLSASVKELAPALGYSLEYQSVMSILMSIAIFFIPWGIILVFYFSVFKKSRRSIIVKGREDIVALRPDQVKVKEE